MGMVKDINEKAEHNSGALSAAILILQMIILPTQGWVGLTLWDMRDRLSRAQEAGSVMETRAVAEHERFDRALADHEDRIRELEKDRGYVRDRTSR